MYYYFLEWKGRYIPFSSLLSIADHVGITISDSGEVTIGGEVDTVSYDMEQWTKEEVYKDVAKTRLPRKYSIFKASPI